MPLSEQERLRYEQALLELRTLQRVAEELSRSLDLEAVMGRLLDLAVEAARAVSGAIYLHEPECSCFQRVVHYLVADEVSPPQLPIGRVMEALDGPSQEMDFTPDSPSSMIQAAWQRGLRRAVLLPLRGEDSRLVGFIVLHFNDAAAVGPTLHTLEAIARQGGFAIANARTHQIAERRAQLANALRELGERALACSDDQALHALILDGALRLTRNDRGLISRVIGDKVLVVAAAGVDADLVGTEMPAATPYMAEALARSGVQAQEDTSLVDPATPIGAVVHRKGTRSLLTATIRHVDRAVGLLFVGSGEPRLYPPEEREALQILASLAGQALERLSAVERLADEKRRLDGVLEHLPVAIVVIGERGDFLHVNRVARESIAASGLSGSWSEALNQVQILDREGKPVPREAFTIMQAFRGEAPPPRELTIVWGEGKRMHGVVLSAPLFGADGKVEAVVCCLQDVTALRELADAKDHFLRVASHELRSPLTALRATTSLLEIDPSAILDAERRALLLSRIQRQVARLTRLVEQLIDSVRLNATEPPLERTHTDLKSLCSEVIEALAEASRVSLEAPSPIEGTWDCLRLEQVLSNLLSNAARYSAAETPIVVRLHREGNQAVLQVIDRGIGIPPEQIGQLFTPFFRASNAPAHSKGGLGLGLHIAHEIVRRHGGTLTVQSTLGEGSRFTVRLPVDTGTSAG